MVFDVLQLQEEFVGMVLGTATEFAAIVRNHGMHKGVMLLEEGQDVVVEHVDGSHRQFGGVEPSPSITIVTVDDGLQIASSDAFEGVHMEGIHPQ